MLSKATAIHVRDVINPVGVQLITPTKSNVHQRQRGNADKNQWHVEMLAKCWRENERMRSNPKYYTGGMLLVGV